MSPAEEVERALARHPRRRLATLPTPLEPGPGLPGGRRLYVKRDDLTGLGLGGNKARKLEYLCGAAEAAGADTLVTVGAAQSNHARMTAAAGTVMGLETHLVLGGEPQDAGNQRLARLFGARLHHPGTEDWDELAEAADDLIATLEQQGRRVYAMPMGGSTALGALGYLAAWAELMGQCHAERLRPGAIVHATSTGGTHGGLLAGRTLWQARGHPDVPLLIPVAVAQGGGPLAEGGVALARAALQAAGLADVEVDSAMVEVDGRFLGRGYGVPSKDGARAAGWAARRGGWVLDQTYTAKAFAGLLAAVEEGRVDRGEAVVFWHTGGHPAVFA